MRNSKRAIHVAPSGSSNLVKPEPPADMWSRLDAEVKAHVQARHHPPNNGFTRAEFQQRYHVGSESSARRHLAKLMRAGKVKKVGYVGVTVYYVMAEDDK